MTISSVQPKPPDSSTQPPLQDGGDAEGSLSTVMGYAQGSTSAAITVTVEARFGSLGNENAIIKNSILTIDGSKR